MISHANDFRSLPNLIRPVVGRAQPPVASAVSAVLAGAELLLLAPLVLEALEGSDVFFSGRLW